MILRRNELFVFEFFHIFSDSPAKLQSGEKSLHGSYALPEIPSSKRVSPVKKVVNIQTSTGFFLVILRFPYEMQQDLEIPAEFVLRPRA